MKNVEGTKWSSNDEDIDVRVREKEVLALRGGEGCPSRDKSPYRKVRKCRWKPVKLIIYKTWLLDSCWLGVVRKRRNRIFWVRWQFEVAIICAILVPYQNLWLSTGYKRDHLKFVVRWIKFWPNLKHGLILNFFSAKLYCFNMDSSHATALRYFTKGA